ncbi:hypothetical protein K438DRAFT_834729 [Mycena galopus ATCC 62051]|nr:hypothetical protein K438DRAFT_834729 [Mycena galopus ATCC 62051]
MKTLVIVHAYVGLFLSLLSLPPPLRDLYRIRRLATPNYFIQQHTPDAAPGSEGCIRRYQTSSDASPCGVEGHLGHQDAPAWA